MYGRNLPAKEVQIRIAEMESDCAYIEANASDLAYTYSFQVVNDDDHSFNDSANDVYKFVWDLLKTDANLRLGQRHQLLLDSRSIQDATGIEPVTRDC
jgi:hypothetical protein